MIKWGMDENPYKSPCETTTERRPHFTRLKWYGAVAGIAMVTFLAFAVIAFFFGY